MIRQHNEWNLDRDERAKQGYTYSLHVYSMADKLNQQNNVKQHKLEVCTLY